MGPDWCFYSPWRALRLAIRSRWRNRRRWDTWHPLDEDS